MTQTEIKNEEYTVKKKLKKKLKAEKLDRKWLELSIVLQLTADTG